MEIRTEEEWRESILAEIIAGTGVSDLRPGGRLVQIGGAEGRAFFRAQQAALEMRNSYLLGSITTEADIDARGQDVLPDGIARNSGTRALGGAFVFSRPAGAGPEITIPAGTPVYRSTDKYRALTIADAVIPVNTANSTPVSAVAETVGTIGNCAAGAYNSLGTRIEGVTSVTNTTAIRNGTDAQTVDEFRQDIRDHVRSINTAVPLAIVKAAKNYESPTYGKVRFAKFDEAEATDRGGYIKLYIDDGAGTSGVVNYSQGELLLSGAAGIERKLYVASRPVLPKGAGPLDYSLRINGGTVTTGWSIVEPWGQLRFDAALAEGDVVEFVNFGYYTGLVAEVQSIVDGALNNITEYPGKRSGGVIIQVLPASKTPVTVSASLVMKNNASTTTWYPILQDTVANLVNSGDIGQGVVRAAIIDKIMDSGMVHNIVNLKINGVDADLYVGESSVARMSAADVSF